MKSPAAAPQERAQQFQAAGQNSSVGETKLGNRSVVKISAPPRDVQPIKTDLIAFAQVEYLCYESDPSIEIGLVRRGTGKGVVTVDWATENQSVMDESYEDFSGTVEFADGQFTQSIALQIIDNDEWNLEALELVHLKNPSSNAQLGDLQTATVCILNEDVFPHDEDDCEDAMAMVKAFFLHMYHDLRSDTNLGLFLRVYPALAWVVTQLVLLFALRKAIPNKDEQLVAILAGCYVTSTLLWHICMDSFENMKLGGKARMILRRAVVGTLLQLTNAEGEKFTSGKCLAIMSEQVENAGKYLRFYPCVLI